MTDASKPLTWEKYRDSTLKHETQYTQNQCMYTWNACQEACAAHAAEKDATIARLQAELAAAMNSLRWAYHHASTNDEMTTGEQEDFSDHKEQARKILFPNVEQL